MARRLKIDRSTIANLMRLLELPEPVLEAVRTEAISAGHARALLPLGEESEQIDYCSRIRKDGWSVRETERRARAAAQESKGPKAKEQKSANVRDLEERLTRTLGTRVTVADRKGKGHLQISFSSYDELDRLLEVFGTRG